MPSAMMGAMMGRQVCVARTRMGRAWVPPRCFRLQVHIPEFHIIGGDQ